ncbi:hypothetical protein ZIOFF_058830 [Zingiber officinale]|uniref:ZF-HD dimerization-type domain-containing protein n=1 Tax=Zingiber officinale TaxID=94328 RepID=A0A8J5FH38_ZINOF|nr:hypothetical protein ZIOFF_058830 [Zingiber officinale]
MYLSCVLPTHHASRSLGLTYELPHDLNPSNRPSPFLPNLSPPLLLLDHLHGSKHHGLCVSFDDEVESSRCCCSFLLFSPWMESLARRAQGMELSGHGGDMAIPISSVHDSPPLHHHHHHHQVLSNGPPPPPPPPPLLVLPVASGGTEEQQQCGGRKAAAKYRECLKNHAASIGGNATDGCGEFMPSGEEGSMEALKCSACGCHRNFHRKEAEGEEQLPSPLEYLRPLSQLRGTDARKAAVGSAPRLLLPGPNHYHHLLPRVAGPHGMIMPLQQQQQTSESEEMEVARPAALMMKKRFRTKFTAEQKEKMLGFAEKAGWRLQKQEDSVVQQFCQEIGVKRRVLKVWMHNNKHNLAKKHPPPPHLSPL